MDVCLETIVNGLGAAFEAIWQFINRPLFITITSTFVAAFAGAYGAQSIAENNRKKNNLLKEIRNTNAAIMALHGICERCFDLKTQHVVSLKKLFDEQKADAIRLLHSGSLFKLEADLRALYPLTLPVEIVEKHLFEQISANAKTLAATSTLIGAVHSLNESINKRSVLIQEYKEKGLPSRSDFIYLYFGIEDEHGNRDTSFSDTIDAIYNQTDDCIFFSSLMCAELSKHGIRKKKELGDSSVNINTINFNDAEELGLMPDSKNYADWLNKFPELDQ